MTRKSKNSNAVPPQYSYPQQPPTGYAYPYPQQPAYPVPAPPDTYSVSITVLVGRDATVAKAVYASVYNTGSTVSATGTAKREPGDLPDTETGRLLATSRALQSLAGKLRKQADGRVRSAAAIKAHREYIKNRPPGGYPREARPGEVTMAFRTVGPVTMAQTPAEQKKARG